MTVTAEEWDLEKGITTDCFESSKAVKIGLCYDFQILEKIPTEIQRCSDEFCDNGKRNFRNQVKVMLFDSHAHYNDERFKDDVDEVLSAMNENNVGLILNSCSSLDEVPDIFAICEKYPFVYASVGIHPHEVSELTEADMDKLKEYAKNPKVKAIGEIGLDYFYDFSPRDIQQKWFARQVDVARELKMPVVIHDREAHKDCMDILREHKVSGSRRSIPLLCGKC